MRPAAHPVVQHQVSLTGLNTFGVGATAQVVITLDDLARLDEVLNTLREECRVQPEKPSSNGDGPPASTTLSAASAPVQTPVAHRPLILSGGSNVVFARDLVEPVLLVRNRGRRIVSDDGEQVLLDVAAGEVWHDTVRWTLDEGCFGLENLALIPGRVGAAPWQNIGAYGTEAGQFIDSVEAVHLQSGERRRFSQAECSFAYRQSFFKTADGRDWLIIGVRLRLSRRFQPQLGYGELAAAIDRKLEEKTTTPGQHGLTAHLVADTVEEIRRRKLPDPAVLGNAGSFFHNPVVDASTLDALRAQHPSLPAHPVAGTDGTSVPGQNADDARPDNHAGGSSSSSAQRHASNDTRAVYPADAPAKASAITHYKLSAGWLIDACGWKGHREGDAGVSPNHALVLVNHGKASGADILRLSERIQQSVFERFGVKLHPEPLIIR
ncbi:MAG: UDP-N-acetylmuramate dehydrogenase [Lautropia sp.]|nr:UDP-N-acetylmuramate dehydrogenase [Lautropia sp.]